MDTLLPDLSQYWLAKGRPPAPEGTPVGEAARHADAMSDEQELAALTERVNAARAVA